MRTLVLGIAGAFVVGILLGLAVLALLADAPVPQPGDLAVAALAPAPAAPAPAVPYTLANGTLALGLPNVGPVNATASLDLDAPANLSMVRVLVTPLSGASAGLHASGLGACSYDFGNVAAQGQTLAFDCVPAPHGHQRLAFSQQSGEIRLQVLVLGIPPRLS